MSTIPISSGVKRSNRTKLNRTSAPTTLAALLAVGWSRSGQLLQQLPKKRNPIFCSSWVTTPAIHGPPSLTVFYGL